MEMAIDACRKRGAYCGICGQAPSSCAPLCALHSASLCASLCVSLGATLFGRLTDVLCARGCCALADVAQAPSDFPELTRWLVQKGINSIALSADAVMQMANVVAEAEAELHVTPAKGHK